MEQSKFCPVCEYDVPLSHDRKDCQKRYPGARLEGSGKRLRAVVRRIGRILRGV